jgi:hypothetical protein
MFIRISLLVIVIGSAVSALAQKSTIRGTIVDATGAVIGNAYVLIHTDALDREHRVAYQLELRTNKQGKFTATVPSGFFDLFVGAGGFAPSCRKIRTRGGRSQDIEVALELDPLSLKEYGDEFITEPPPVEPQRSSVPPLLQEAPH